MDLDQYNGVHNLVSGVYEEEMQCPVQVQGKLKPMQQ